MLKHNRKDGFTIIEVSIAIALIMGGMIVAVVAINSRLRQENFYKGTTRFGSVLNDILNDVSTNNWPNVDGWECGLDTVGDIKFTSNPSHKTGDGDCLYVGKVIQFGDNGAVVEDDNTYIVHTIMTHRDALIPIYEFDTIAKLASPLRRLHPLGVLEKTNTPPLPPDFSTRETESWPNGMQIEQVYYLDGPDPMTDKVYLQGIAVVQLAGHGLTENDLLLQSGAGRVGIRVVRNKVLSKAKLPSENRPNADDFAESLKRTPKMDRLAYSDISRDFNLPIHICIGDGRGREALALLGGEFSSLLVETEFDETKIATHCS